MSSSSSAGKSISASERVLCVSAHCAISSDSVRTPAQKHKCVLPRWFWSRGQVKYLSSSSVSKFPRTSPAQKQELPVLSTRFFDCSKMLLKTDKFGLRLTYFWHWLRDTLGLKDSFDKLVALHTQHFVGYNQVGRRYLHPQWKRVGQRPCQSTFQVASADTSLWQGQVRSMQCVWSCTDDALMPTWPRNLHTIWSRSGNQTPGLFLLDSTDQIWFSCTRVCVSI